MLPLTLLSDYLTLTETTRRFRKQLKFSYMLKCN